MELFKQMLREAGMPVTVEEMNAQWQAINVAEGHHISNNSAWSPFWRLITAIVTLPCRKLVELLVNHALPNSFLRYASGDWLDVYAWGVDIVRKPATKAVGSIAFTRETPVGELRVPAGTIIESPRINGHVYRVETTAETVGPDGILTFEVPVEAQQAGSASNLGPGYYSILAEPLPGIVSVVNGDAWLTYSGADRESDEEFRMRCRNQFSAVGQYHHDAAYRACIASFAGIRVDYITFEHDAPRGPGSANAYIMQDTGAPPQELVDTINQYIRDSGNHGHGDDMVCFPMPEQAHDLTVTVHPADHLSNDRVAALLHSVEDMVRCAFRQNTTYPGMTRTWPHDRFSFSRLDEELHAALPALKSVEFSIANDIVTQLALPTLGDLTVREGA